MIIDAFILYANNRVAAEAKPLAGADIVMQSNSSRSEKTTSEVTSLVWGRWIVSRRIQLNTNITSDTDSRLVQLLGVDNAFPLYWTVSVQALSGRVFSFGSWVAVDQRTYDMIDWWVIAIWERKVAVDGVIQDNPWLTLNLFTQWRQVIMPIQRMEQTWLLRTWSRAEYQYLLRVYDPNNSQKLLDDLRGNEVLKWQRRIDNFQQRISQVGTILDELGIYLLVVIFCWFLLVAVTSMLSIDEYLYRRLRTIGIMQILWARKTQLLLFYWLLFLSMAIVSISVANGVVTIVSNRVWSLPAIAWFSVSASSRVNGMQVAIILIAVARSLPLLKIIFRTPLEGLAETSINIATKRERIRSILIVVTWILLVLRIIWETRLQTLMLWWALLGWFVLLRWLIKLLLYIWARINARFVKGFILFDAIRSTTRPGNTTILIASTLIVALSAVLLITQFGGSFVQRLTINNASQPNRYVVNLTKNDIDALREQWIKDKAFNVILGRIISINDIPLQDYLDKNISNASENWWEWRFTREYNITTTALLPKETVSGPVTVPKDWVSVDRWFAKSLWLSMGDKIRFNIAGREFVVTITSMRESDRTSFTPFFYFQLNSEQFADAPMTYFLTMKVAEDKKVEVRKLITSVIRPWVAFIEIDNIIWSIRIIAERVVQVVQILLAVILLFAIFTNLVCVENMRYAKAYKMRLYYILWASTRQTRHSIICEYWYILWIAILTSVLMWRWVAAYFIWNSDFLDRSWPATYQWLLIIALILIINVIAVRRSMK
jgi:putative ABC transport system permease protein